MNTPDLSSSNEELEKEKLVIEFHELIDSTHVIGSILIYSAVDDTYFSNDYKWASIGQLPASTFKIPNSIIALETGVVENDSSLFMWEGEERRLEVWEQDLLFREAFQYSCVPCYQEVARGVGADRMMEFVTKLNYGKMKIDSSNVDGFWLQGESRINQFEQIDFLRRFYNSELPIDDRTVEIVQRMMIIEDNDQYRISGKTGWSITDGRSNGWFVGFVENQRGVYYFATNVDPQPQLDMNEFPSIRKEITFEALQFLNVIGG